jgi:hypothetical protein
MLGISDSEVQTARSGYCGYPSLVNDDDVTYLQGEFFGTKTEKIGFRKNGFWVNFFLKNRHFLFDNLFILETMRVPFHT